MYTIIFIIHIHVNADIKRKENNSKVTIDTMNPSLIDNTSVKDELLIDETPNVSGLRKLKRISKKLVTTTRSFQSDSITKAKGFSDDYQTVDSTSRALKLSLLAILLYSTFGTLTFAKWMDWSTIDALYFTVITFTTVGYGDITANESDAIMLFMAIFIIFGICVLGGIALTIIFDRLFRIYEEQSKQRKLHQQRYYLNLFDSNILDDAGNEDNQSLGKEISLVLIKNIPLIIAVIVPSFIIGYIEDWTIPRSVYFCAVTATTGMLNNNNHYFLLIVILLLIKLCY